MIKAHKGNGPHHTDDDCEVDPRMKSRQDFKVIPEPLAKAYPKLNSLEITKLREEFKKIEQESRIDELTKLRVDCQEWVPAARMYVVPTRDINARIAALQPPHKDQGADNE